MGVGTNVGVSFLIPFLVAFTGKPKGSPNKRRTHEKHKFGMGRLSLPYQPPKASPAKYLHLLSQARRAESRVHRTRYRPESLFAQAKRQPTKNGSSFWCPF